MAEILLEGTFYGVKALHYRQGYQYRVTYFRASDNKFIGDVPIQGLREPWTEETVRYSITRLFFGAWEEKAKTAVNHGRYLNEFLFDFEKGVIRHGREYDIFRIGEWIELDE